jgi:hypothetical protein
MRLGGQPLDEAPRPAHQGNDPASVAMHFVNPADGFAVERSDRLVAEVAEPHHSAPLRGIHARTRFSTA